MCNTPCTSKTQICRPCSVHHTARPSVTKKKKGITHCKCGTKLDVYSEHDKCDECRYKSYVKSRSHSDTANSANCFQTFNKAISYLKHSVDKIKEAQEAPFGTLLMFTNTTHQQPTLGIKVEIHPKYQEEMEAVLIQGKPPLIWVKLQNGQIEGVRCINVEVVEQIGEME